MKALIERLHALSPAISDILSVTGTAGTSIGVVHHGETIYTKGFGYRDIENNLSMDRDTVVSLFSLTKAIVASAIGILVDEGLATFDTPLIEILPDFRHHDATIQKETTIRDLLAHRTGLAQYNAIWMQDQGRLYLDKGETLVTATTLPVTARFREKFQYNNWNFALLSLAVERLSGLSLGNFLKGKLFIPLGMDNTSIVRPVAGHNLSEGYMALSDGSCRQIERPHVGDDKIMFGANGVNSCVKDLLKIYSKMLSAATGSDNNTPFREITTIISGQVATSSPSILERSYGFGWHRSQLPNTLAGSGMNGKYMPQMPVVARGCKPQLAIYHGGNSAACQNWVVLLPETESVIVVLTNTMANSDASNWIASMLVETLLDSPEKHDFVALAQSASKRSIQLWEELYATMERERSPDTRQRELKQYVGKYWNHVGNWCLEVYIEGDDDLRIAFQSDRERSHAIRHYHYDIFTWLMTQDENARHGRFPYTSPGQWLINFQADDTNVVGLRWNQNGIRDGEYFHKGE